MPKSNTKVQKSGLGPKLKSLKINDFGNQNLVKAGIRPGIAGHPLGLILRLNAGRPAHGLAVKIIIYAV